MVAGQRLSRLLSTTSAQRRQPIAPSLPMKLQIASTHAQQATRTWVANEAHISVRRQVAGGQVVCCPHHFAHSVAPLAGCCQACGEVDG